MELTEKKILRRDIFSGAVIDVHVDQVELPNGSMARREVVDHPGAVAVIPVDSDGSVYCVRQFRYPVGEVLLEVPAGKLARGEDPCLCAERELSEETGFSAGRMTYLGKIYSSPGFAGEVLYLYLAEELVCGKAHPDADEFLDIERISLDELARMVTAGEVPDAKTQIAVLRTKMLMEERSNG